MSGVTTMLGGGTGPATGTKATTYTPGPWHLRRMLEAAELCDAVIAHFQPKLLAGRRVLVAWKPAREAARALATALPLLKQAEHVEVAHWRESGEAHTALPADEPHTTPAALEDWLQAHGVRARHTQQGDTHADIGEQLLSLAAHVDADLLVMGCYGRSRTREWLLGGATRTVLQSMTVPVWMAH